MATTALTATNPTLLDMVKRQNPDGSQAKVVESLSKKTPLLQDMAFIEGNTQTGHRFATRTGLPSLTWRKFNAGVDPSKSIVDQIDEACGMVEGQSVVDAELASLNGNAAAFRASEDMAFTQAFKIELETGMFYHSTKTAPEKFMGLSPRMDVITGALFPKQLIASRVAAAANANTSVWLVCWSPDTVFGITPKGQPAGLVPHDMGEQLVLDANSKRFRAWVTVWNWKVGLCVKDARYLVRICNIGSTNIIATGKLLLQDMVDAFHQLYDHSTGRCAWYTNRLIGKFLHQQALDSVAQSTLSIEKDLETGTPVTRFMGIPVRETDAILNTEATLA